MIKHLRITALSVALFGTMLAMPAAEGSINKNVRIEAGETSDGGSSVNGNIKVGEAASVTGDLTTVNGGISIADGAAVSNVETVNGRVSIGNNVQLDSSTTVNGRNKLGENVIVSSEVSTVNGKIDIGTGTRVGEDVSAVNGKITMSGADVSGNVVNVNGGMDILDASIVRGDVIVRKPKKMGFSWGKRSKPRIVIGRSVVIEGTLVLEQPVNLYVHESARVNEIRGEDVDIQRFSGDRPGD
ncbi:MAG: hypothetical protein AAAFM81_04330 [Pseudomonadota bacterium]